MIPNVLITTVVACVAALVAKLIVRRVFADASATGKFQWSTRGMPSGHAATLAGLVGAMVLTYGFDHPSTLTALTLGCLYLFDLMLVYYGADVNGKDGHPLGHSVQEIIAGAVLGVVVAISMNPL